MKPLRLAALAVLFAAPAAASPSLEQLRSAAGPLTLPSATPARPRPVTPPRNAEMLGYWRGGYTFQSDAERALNEAKSNLRAAGVAVLGAELIREHTGSLRWGFRLSYTDPDRYSSRRVETYRSGTYRFSSDAERAMRETIAELRRAGVTVVLGTLIRGQGLDTHYEVDTLERHGAPSRDQIVTSRHYLSLADCQRDMQRESQRLGALGYRVVDQRVLRDGRNGQYFFQIRYTGRFRR